MADSDLSPSLWIFLGIGPKYFFDLKDQHWLLGGEVKRAKKKTKNFLLFLIVPNSMGIAIQLLKPRFPTH